MSQCEKCWGDAYLRWMAEPSKSQAEHYRDLLKERENDPCTPEQQTKARALATKLANDVLKKRLIIKQRWTEDMADVFAPVLEKIYEVLERCMDNRGERDKVRELYS